MLPPHHYLLTSTVVCLHDTQIVRLREIWEELPAQLLHAWVDERGVVASTDLEQLAVEHYERQAVGLRSFLPQSLAVDIFWRGWGKKGEAGRYVVGGIRVAS